MNEFTPRKGLKLPDQTASRALTTDANSKVTSSSVTSTELGYLSGVTSAIQTQLNTNSTGLSDHLSDTVDAHDASAISNVPAGNLAATTVQAALDELQSDIDTRATSSSLTDHLNDTTDAHDASAISNVASGNLAATDVQAALNELQTDVDTRQLRSTLTTKGDIYVATASDTVTRLPVGTNGYTLQADSAQAEGIKWAAPAAVAIGDSITSATAGSIFFAGTAGVLAQDNANLFYDDTNNRLGIGTTTPNQTLDVLHGTGVYFQSSVTNNTAKVSRIGSLSYANSAYFPLVYGTASGAAGTNNAFIVVGGGTASGYAANTVSIYTAANDTTTTGTERVRVDSSGRVGIGAAPDTTSELLLVSSGTNTFSEIRTTDTGSVSTLIFNNTGGTKKTRIGMETNDTAGGAYSNTNAYAMVISTDSTQDISLRTNDTTRMTVGSGGTIYMGTTTSGTGVSASSATDVIEFIPGNYAGFTNSTGGNYNIILNKSGSVTGTVAGFRYNGSDVGTISINTTNTAYNTSSDGRLKTNFTPLEGLSKVMQLEPVKYDWTHQPGATGTGFVAQDLHQIIPEAVTVGDLDETKRFGDEGFKSWGVDYSKVVPYLVKALQELKTEFDAYKETHP